MTNSPASQAATVVLLSGGVDSAVMLYSVHERARAAPLFVDYAQRAARTEEAMAAHHAQALGLPLQRLDMSAVGEAFRAEQQAKLHVPLPHRNLVLLGLALAYAAQIRASAVAIAVTADDLEWYPSASADFLSRFRDLAQSLGGASISTPLIHLDQRGVLAEGVRLGVDFARTHSCMRLGARHCGKCSQCEKRQRAFSEAGVDEPADFYGLVP
jgi:7-cyano-7-deazaguanine synthase